MQQKYMTSSTNEIEIEHFFCVKISFLHVYFIPFVYFYYKCFVDLYEVKGIENYGLLFYFYWVVLTISFRFF